MRCISKGASRARGAHVRTGDGLWGGEGVEGIGDRAHGVRVDVQVHHKARLQRRTRWRTRRLDLAAQRSPKHRTRQRCASLRSASPT